MVSTLTITGTKEKNMINLYDFCKASAYTDTARHVEFEIFHEEDETFSNKMQANFTNILQYAAYKVISIMPKGDKLELIIQKPNCEESVK